MSRRKNCKSNNKNRSNRKNRSKRSKNRIKTRNERKAKKWSRAMKYIYNYLIDLTKANRKKEKIELVKGKKA